LRFYPQRLRQRGRLRLRVSTLLEILREALLHAGFVGAQHGVSTLLEILHIIKTARNAIARRGVGFNPS